MKATVAYEIRPLNSHALGVRHTHLTQISLMTYHLTHYHYKISHMKTDRNSLIKHSHKLILSNRAVTYYSNKLPYIYTG